MGVLGFAWKGAVYLVVVLCLAAALRQFLENYGRERAYFAEQERHKARIGAPNYPLIVLYHGHPPEASYEWNSGVWPAWGKGKPREDHGRHAITHDTLHQTDMICFDDRCHNLWNGKQKERELPKDVMFIVLSPTINPSYHEQMP